MLTALKLWRIIKRAITRSRSLQGCFQLGGKRDLVTPVRTTTTQNLKHGSSILKICSEKTWVGVTHTKVKAALSLRGEFLRLLVFHPLYTFFASSTIEICAFCPFPPPSECKWIQALSKKFKHYRKRNAPLRSHHPEDIAPQR